MNVDETTIAKDGGTDFKLPPVPCPVLSADSLLERAHDMLARAHFMLDGWQQAVDWHNDYMRYKEQKP